MSGPIPSNGCARQAATAARQRVAARGLFRGALPQRRARRRQRALARRRRPRRPARAARSRPLAEPGRVLVNQIPPEDVAPWPGRRADLRADLGARPVVKIDRKEGAKPVADHHVAGAGVQPVVRERHRARRHAQPGERPLVLDLQALRRRARRGKHRRQTAPRGRPTASRPRGTTRRPARSETDRPAPSSKRASPPGQHHRQQRRRRRAGRLRVGHRTPRARPPQTRPPTNPARDAVARTPSSSRNGTSVTAEQPPARPPARGRRHPSATAIGATASRYIAAMFGY